MKKNKTQKGITLIALIITVVLLLILVAVTVSSITNHGILSKAEHSLHTQRAAYIQEQINLTLNENKIKEYSTGECTNKKNLIDRLVIEEILKPEEAAILNEKDTIEIDGIIVDFSVLNSTILISPNNLFIETKEDGTFEIGKLKAELKNISGEITWEIKKGAEYISLQEDKGKNITVKAKEYGTAEIVAKCGDYISDSCIVIIAKPKHYVQNYSELQSAINEVEENETIYLAAGVYEEEIVLCKNSNSTPLKNVSIQGIGNVTVSTIDLKGSQNITIQGINFDVSKSVEAKDYNNKVSQYYASIYDNNIESAGAKNITIKDCTFEGNPPTDKKYICIYNNDQGFSGHRSTNFEINGCNFKCNAFAYINLSYTIVGDIKILNNMFGGNEYSTAYANIFFSTTLANLTVINNTFTNWASANVAIELMGPADSQLSPKNIPELVVTGNTFQKTTIPAENEKAIKYRRGRTTYNVSDNKYTGNINYLLDSSSIDHTIHKSLET